MHRLALVLLLVLAASSSAAGADAVPYGQTLSFAVMRQGQQIGSHKLVFERDGSHLKVSTSIDLAVKLVGITAYRYSHRAQEVWDGDALLSLTSRTDDDGKAYAVQANRTAEGSSFRRRARAASCCRPASFPRRIGMCARSPRQSCSTPRRATKHT